MADATSPVSTSVKPADKSPVPSEFTLIDVITKLRQETKSGDMIDCILVAHPEVEHVINEVFDTQDAFENPSKFLRAFLFDAVVAQAKITCNAAVNDYVRLLDKAARFKPRMTREAVEKELLESRKARQIKDRADRALALKARL